MRRLLVAFVMLSMLSPLAACGSDSATGTSASVNGTYTLTSINGQPMPFVLFSSGSTKSEVTAGSLTINSGSYTALFNFRDTVNGSVTTSSETDAGTYTMNGTAITLRSQDNSTLTGSLSGNTLTISEAGAAYIFTKS